MAAQSAAEANIIAYAPHPRSRLRRLRPIVLALLIVSAAWPAWHFAPAIALWARERYWYGQCAKFAPDPAAVVFEALPPGTAMPATSPPFTDSTDASLRASWRTVAPGRNAPNRPVLITRAPTCLVRLLAADPASRVAIHGFAVIFCHERVTPGGKRRLVCAWFDPNWGTGDSLLDLQFMTLSPPGSTNGPPESYAGEAIPPPPLPPPRRIFAGQIDGADASHFTIEYQWPDEQLGIIDAWLTDDGPVKYEIRSGPGDLDHARQSLHDHPERWKYH